MILTDNFKLGLFEPEERISLAALNDNTERVDEALQTHEGALTIRAKMQTGSWAGQTACAAPESYTVYSASHGSKKLTGTLGSPAGSSRDIVLTLDFEPSVVVVSGHMEEDVNWSGYLLSTTQNTDGTYASTYSKFTHAGREYISYRQVIHSGQRVGHGEVTARFPAVATTSFYGGSTQKVGWADSCIQTYYNSGSFGAEFDASAPVPCQIPTLVEFGTTEDGKYTVTIKGANSDYGTENYADIEGMTYHWVAFG